MALVQFCGTCVSADLSEVSEGGFVGLCTANMSRGQNTTCPGTKMPEAHGSKNVSSLTTVMMAKDASHKLKLQNVIGKVSTFLNSLLVLTLYLYKQRVKLTFVEKFMIVK